MAFSEMCLTFAGRTWVPDLAVYRWDHLPLDEENPTGL